MRKSSKWELTIYEEEDDELKVCIKGPSKKVQDLMMLEVLLRGLRSWDSDVDFKDGQTPKDITKTWIMPLSKVKAKLNPSKQGKAKPVNREEEFEHAIEMYRKFNGTDPSEIVVQKLWMPDESSPLVAIGEGTCPFVGYSSGKTNKKGEMDTYIHHFGEDDATGEMSFERPRIYVTMPPAGYQRMLIIVGGDWDIEERQDGIYWLVH
jgi:hypothetical protein